MQRDVLSNIRIPVLACSVAGGSKLYRNSMRYLILITALIVSTIQAETPEDVIRSYVDKIKSDGLGGVAGLMHPDELTKFQNMMSPVIEEALNDSEGRMMFGRFTRSFDEGTLGQLTAEEFMATFLQSLEAIQPQLSEILKSASVEVIGHVNEGDVSHVVARFRTQMGGMEIEKMTVMSTKDYQGSAKMMLSGEIKQMAEVLRSLRR